MGKVKENTSSSQLAEVSKCFCTAYVLENCSRTIIESYARAAAESIHSVEGYIVVKLWMEAAAVYAVHGPRTEQPC